MAPSACQNEKLTINLFTRPNYTVSISGRENVPFKLIKTDTFYIKGFSGISPIADSCCCEAVWNSFYESGADQELRKDKIYASYSNQGENVCCCIGEEASEGQKIPGSKWACFTLNTVDDDIVNRIYSKIIYEWLPSANLKRNQNMPTVEVYPFDMSEEGFEWEIRIPIE